MTPSQAEGGPAARWSVRKIVVVGPGIVGMPMAALLARARVREGLLDDEPAARVVVVQRNSPTSGWKVDAINAGRSVIGGIEPGLDGIVREAVATGGLRASHDDGEARDADAVLVCVQTDKRGMVPQYGPLVDALHGVASALSDRDAGRVPLVVIESTLAPSTLATVVVDLFAAHGLHDGHDLLLATSPNRVMPGRLVERIRTGEKLVGGSSPAASDRVVRLYRWIVTEGALHATNGMTAEVVKTLENAYRDVRIAFAAETCRRCDAEGVDFFALRDAVNRILHQEDAASRNPGVVPTGGLLVPTVGVGGHCLPKDGILLLWRRLEAGVDLSNSPILAARRTNDGAPAYLLSLAERQFGPLDGLRVALLGVAYRPDAADTRNSPTLVLAGLLRDRHCTLRLHDPHVHPRDQNLLRDGWEAAFTRDPEEALRGAEVVVFCAAHRAYAALPGTLLASSEGSTRFVDGCNLWSREQAAAAGRRYCGLGRGSGAPTARFAEEVATEFRAVETAVAREIAATIDDLNRSFARDAFSAVRYDEVRRLAATCTTGCALPALTD